MSTDIHIDSATLDAALCAGPFRIKKAAVEAGLKLLVRQAAHCEVLKRQGKIAWDDDDDEGSTSTPPAGQASALRRRPVSGPAVNEWASKHAVAKALHGRR